MFQIVSWSIFWFRHQSKQYTRHTLRQDAREAKKRQSEKERENEELLIQTKEKELMDKGKVPESAPEWERLMISNPQNSMVCIQSSCAGVGLA